MTNKPEKRFNAVILIDDKASDDDLRRLWAQNFPKRLSDPKSKALWLAFCIMVEHRAADDVSDDDDLLVTVHETLIALGIPRDECDEMEKESDTPESHVYRALDVIVVVLGCALVSALVFGDRMMEAAK